MTARIGVQTWFFNRNGFALDHVGDASTIQAAWKEAEVQERERFEAILAKGHRLEHVPFGQWQCHDCERFFVSLDNVLGQSACTALNVTDSRPALTPIGEPCLDCGKAVVWYADALSGESLERIDLWMRVSEHNAVYFLCPTCFILRAEAKGIREIWRLTPTLGTMPKGKNA